MCCQEGPKDQEGMNLNGLNQVSVCADNVNLLGEIVISVPQRTEKCRNSLIPVNKLI
jgi:hypothetical protein